MRPFYDHEAVKRYVSRAISDGPRGTQQELARRVGVAAPTAAKWADGQGCPSPRYWPALETFFGWKPGTLEGIGGVGPVLVADVEAAIIASTDLDPLGRDLVLDVYRVAVRRAARNGSPTSPPDGPTPPRQQPER